jgi:hypothetical protein
MNGLKKLECFIIFLQVRYTRLALLSIKIMVKNFKFQAKHTSLFTWIPTLSTKLANMFDYSKYEDVNTRPTKNISILNAPAYLPGLVNGTRKDLWNRFFAKLVAAAETWPKSPTKFCLNLSPDIFKWPVQ